MPTLEEEWASSEPLSLEDQWGSAEPITETKNVPEKRIPLYKWASNAVVSSPYWPPNIISDSIISLGRFGKRLYENPKEGIRLAYQGAGATAGGVLGGPVGGALGYAIGQKGADIMLGDRPAYESGATPSEQIKGELVQSGKDIGVGGLYELGGGAMNLSGKVVGNIADALVSINRKGIKGAYTDLVTGIAEKSAAKKIAQVTSKTTTAQKIMEANRLKTSILEDEIPGLQFNLGQKTVDPNLLSLARQKAQQPGFSTEMGSYGPAGATTQNQAIIDYIQNDIRGGGNVDNFLSSIDKTKKAIETQTGIARQGVETEATKITGRTEQDIGGQLQEKAFEARQESGQIASKLYDDVPNGLKIDSSPLRDKVDELFGGFDPFMQRLSATPTGAMARAKRAMGDTEQELEGGWLTIIEGPAEVTMKQMKDFRSQMGTVQREALSSGDHELAYNAGQLKESVNETLGLAAKRGEGTAVEKLRRATDYWRDVHVPTYRQGTTGKILATDKTGAQRVLDSSIPGTYFKAGKGAAEAADDFIKIFGRDQEAKGLMADYAAYDLLRSARNKVTGELDSNAVSRWLNNHQDALDKFGLKGQFGDLQKSINLAEKAVELESEFNKSVFARMLNADPEKAIGQALGTGLGRIQATQRLKQMVAIAKKDSTGAAIEGLKAGIGDFFKNTTNVSARASDLSQLESLAKVDNFMKHYAPALKSSGLYSPKELKAFDNVHQVLKVIAQQQRPHVGYSNSATWDLITRTIGTTASVASGHLGVYGLAGTAFSRLEKFLVKDKLEESIARAIFDPRYAEAIQGLAMNTKKMTAQKAAERFNKRIMSLGIMTYETDNQQ